MSDIQSAENDKTTKTNTNTDPSVNGKALIDKQLLIAALSADKAFYENAARNSAAVGKAELASQMLDGVASGRFDFHQEEPVTENAVPESV